MSLITEIKGAQFVPYNVTSLVNNIIIPETEPSDIIGIDSLKDVEHWIIVPNGYHIDLSFAYKIGNILSLILIEDVIFVGTDSNHRGELDVENIAKRIKAHRDSENSPR